jgi:hypothetical protein
MTKTDLDYFRDALRIKQTELAFGSQTREIIAIERSAEALEEVAFKSAREIAVTQLHRESVIRRDVRLALKRLPDQTCSAGPRYTSGRPALRSSIRA